MPSQTLGDILIEHLLKLVLLKRSKDILPIQREKTFSPGLQVPG